MNKHIDEQEEKAPLPNNVIELDNMAHDIWYKYFRPEKPLGKDERKAMMKEYNEIADKRNKLGGFKALIILTPSTVATIPAEKPEPKAKDKSTVTQRTAPVAQAAAGEPKPGSKIAEIIALHVAGKTNKEIIESGYNKSTVNRQVSEYKKRQLKK